MTWQDELRHLESEFAAGRLSAADYRQQRDEVLRRAQPGQADSSGGNAARQDPFPPAFSWNEASTRKQPGVSATNANSDEATEFVHNPLVSEEGGQPAGQSSEQPSPQAPGTGSEQSATQDSTSNDPDSEPTRFVTIDEAAQPSAGQQAGTQQADAQQAGAHQRPIGQQSSPEQSPPQPPPSQQPPSQAPPSQAPPYPAPPYPAPPNWQSGAQQPAWGQPQGGGSAPQSGMPPPVAGPAPERRGPSRMQGPEVFETARTSSKGKVIGGVVIGSVLVVGAIAGTGVYLAKFGGESADDPGTTIEQPPPQPPPEGQPPEAQPPQAPPEARPPEARPPEPPAPALADPPAVKPPPASSQEVLVAPPPGPPHPFNGLVDRPALEGPKASLLSPGVRDFALQHGMIDGWFNGTDATMPKTTLIAIRMPADDAASGLVNAYYGEQAGLTPADDLSYEGVQVRTTGNGTFRTAYVAHGWAIIVDVSGDQSPAVKDQFKAVLDQQVTQTPPTVRQ